MTCGTNQSAQGVICDVPGFPDIGGADDGPQGWQRAANEFLGNIKYPLASLPVLSCGSCVPNTQVVGEPFRGRNGPAAASVQIVLPEDKQKV